VRVTQRHLLSEPVVITGIGLIAALGARREEVWRAVRQGKSGVRRLKGIDGLPDDQFCGATVEMPVGETYGRLKAIALAQHAAREALDDAQLHWPTLDRDRFGCSINGIMGDSYDIKVRAGMRPSTVAERVPWWQQWLPNTMCSLIAQEHGLGGPRLSHSTACASSLVSVLGAVRAIRDNQCDIALCGGGDAIDPLFAAGFKQMRALAESDDPATACKPYDRQRNGFVLGEGAGMFVVERLGHALRRGAKIYAEVAAGRMLAEAHHVTGLDADSDSLARLIDLTLDQAGLAPGDIGYINAHGTGTVQNDLVEMRAIRQAFGADIHKVCVSSTKSMLGHAINGAGAVELAITVLAMRDGFAPPTMNHTDPDPECTFDCLPLAGRVNRFQHGLKLSVAFGGHLVAVVLNRWNDPQSGFAYRDDLDMETPARKAA
jgi:3-oxoacyl-(acyl-carrier-protein) synthase